MTPTLKGSGGICFGTMMFFDAITMRWLATYMAEDITCRLDHDTTPDYLSPDPNSGGDVNPFWQQVRFLHSLTMLHKETPILGWKDHNPNRTESTARCVARALYLAKWWKEKEREFVAKENGRTFGTQTPWALFDPCEFLDEAEWGDIFSRPKHLRLDPPAA
jgi:hypothetical protein